MWFDIGSKYGELRLAWELKPLPPFPRDSIDSLLKAILDLERRAQEDSESTCEYCGLSAALDEYNGWLMTLCELHRKQRRLE
jgi:hypothetical protein